MSSGQTESKYSKSINFQDAIVDKLVKGPEGSFTSRISTALDVRISKSDTWQLRIEGEKVNVDQAHKILEALFSKAIHVSRDNRIQSKSAVGAKDFETIDNELTERLKKVERSKVSALEHQVATTARKVEGMQRQVSEVSSAIKKLAETGEAPRFKANASGSNDNKQSGSGNLGAAQQSSGQKKEALPFLSANFEPRSLTQAIYYLSMEETAIIIGEGSAGGGKTHIPVDYALRNDMKIVAIRPKTTTSGDKPGAYKGDEKKKSRPYMKSFDSVIPRIVENGSLEQLEKLERIEYGTTDHIRGITLSNTLVIIDEAQNLTVDEAKAIITRYGEESEERTIFVFTGDISPHQNDIGFQDSGLVYLVNHLGHAIYNNSNEILERDCSFHLFTNEDSAARSSLLPHILDAFEQLPSIGHGETRKEYISAEDKSAKSWQKIFKDAAENNHDMAREFLSHLSDISFYRYREEAFKRWPQLKSQYSKDMDIPSAG